MRVAGPKDARGTSPLKKARDWAAKVSEAHIQETCSQMLELDGWRRVRPNMKQLRGMGVQEPGMADDLFIRYANRADPNKVVPGYKSRIYDPLAEIMWCE